MKFLLCLLFLIGFTQRANAQANLLSSEAFDIRNKIEKDVQGNLQDLIKTQLPLDTFTVAVRVQLKPITPPKKEEKKQSSDIPAGFDLGVINADELVKSYEKELEEMRILKDQVNKPPQYQLAKLEVVVGLDDRYPASYVGEFKSWLNSKLRKDYGSISSSNVSQYKNVVLPPREEPKAKEKPEVEKEPVKDPPQSLYILYAAAAIALGLLLLGILLRSGLNKVATSTKPLSIEPKGEFTLKDVTPQAEHALEDGSQSSNLPSRAEHFSANEELEKLIKKIAFLCMEVQGKLTELVRVWIDNGDTGYLKTAFLIDSVLIARERILTETGAIAQLKIPLDEETARNHEESISEAYRNIVEMEVEDKQEYLESIYWDLVSIRTLGIQSLRRPFDFFAVSSSKGILS